MRVHAHSMFYNAPLPPLHKWTTSSPLMPCYALSFKVKVKVLRPSGCRCLHSSWMKSHDCSIWVQTPDLFVNSLNWNRDHQHREWATWSKRCSRLVNIGHSTMVFINVLSVREANFKIPSFEINTLVITRSAHCQYPDPTRFAPVPWHSLAFSRLIMLRHDNVDSRRLSSVLRLASDDCIDADDHN